MDALALQAPPTAPPQNIEAERALLGAAMLPNNETALEELRRLDVEAFYILDHRTIATAIAKLVARGSGVDLLTVSKMLLADDELDTVGAAYLASLTDNACSTALASTYAEMVREADTRRRLMHEAAELAKSAGNGVSIDDVLAVGRMLGDRCRRSVRMPRLRSVTAAEDCAGADYSTRFVVAPLLSPGMITLLGGEAKAGKSTLVQSGIAAALFGRPFMGRETVSGPFVYATEEAPSTFRRALRRAGLHESDSVHVVYRRQHPELPWGDFLAGLLSLADQVEAVAVVVDTLPGCAGLVGEQEQDSGVANQVMRPLLDGIAARPSLAVLLTTHTRKGGGTIPEAFRGSSAYSGHVDLLALLRIKARESTTRVLETAGRLDDLPPSLTIEYEDGEYREASSVPEEHAPTDPFGCIPLSGAGMTPSEYQVAAKCSKTTAADRLAAAHKAGTLRRVSGDGTRGKPFRFVRLSSDSSGADATEEADS